MGFKDGLVSRQTGRLHLLRLRIFRQHLAKRWQLSPNWYRNGFLGPALAKYRQCQLAGFINCNQLGGDNDYVRPDVLLDAIQSAAIALA